VKSPGLVPKFILSKREPQELRGIAKRAHTNNPILDDSEKSARRAVVSGRRPLGLTNDFRPT
jgi:hypothetical protein